MASHALIYYVHYVSPEIQTEMLSLLDSIDDDFQMFAVGCCPDRHALDGLASDKVRTHAYVREQLRELPYEQQLSRVDWKTMRYSADLAIMQFFRERPNFDYYWIIEYDVRFTGAWATLVSDLKNSVADLLCSYLTLFEHSPNWMHWKSFASGEDKLEQNDLCRSFLPVSRLSNRLMSGIDERCQRGWTGQYEVLWTTVARSIKGLIEEIGGTGSAVPPERRGKYYHYMTAPGGFFLSTFSAWPSYSSKSEFRKHSEVSLLWHPVKE